MRKIRNFSSITTQADVFLLSAVIGRVYLPAEGSATIENIFSTISIWLSLRGSVGSTTILSELTAFSTSHSFPGGSDRKKSIARAEDDPFNFELPRLAQAISQLKVALSILKSPSFGKGENNSRALSWNLRQSN